MTELLELREVRVTRAGRPILNGASLALAPGERLAVVGANGTGKTTILRTLVGLDRPHAGEVVAFGGVRRTEGDFRPVRLRVGFLFQDPDDQLFCPTVLEDVMFGPLNLGLGQRAAEARARETLARMGLAELAPRITWRLSGGEKRLVCLAAVLAMEPVVLLLDEPTNAVDDVNRERLIALLAGLEVAMIIVSHDRPFLERLASRALVLRDGRLSPATIHRHPRHLEQVHIHGFDEDHPH